MAGYGIAVQQGIQAGTALALGGDSAEAVALYNAAYNAEASKYNALDARIAAERNIASVRSDKLIGDTHIQLTQNTVEAQLRVQAAWAGAEGASVDAVVYETESAEARRLASNNKKARDAKEGYLTDIRSASMELSAIQEVTTPSLGGYLLQAFSSIGAADLEALGTEQRGVDKPKNTFSGEGVPINAAYTGRPIEMLS